MSSQCFTFCIRYLNQLCQLSPPSFKLMHQETLHSVLMALPLHYILERLKSPMRNLERDALFCIQCPDTFYLDLMGYSPDEVLSIENLQTKFTGYLSGTNPTSVVWMVVDVRSCVCRALLHATASSSRSMLLHHLYIQDSELRRVDLDKFPPIHETLLHAFCIFADERCMDIELVGALDRQPCAIMRCILAMNGFLLASSNHCIRPPCRWCTHTAHHPGGAKWLAVTKCWRHWSPGCPETEHPDPETDDAHPHDPTAVARRGM